MSIKIGITGGIGSGKSVVSKLLQLMGVPVYIADVESKRLTETDPDIRAALISLLGDEVYQDGKLNRPLLASYIFGNKDNLTMVNGIIHPRIKDDFRRWAQSHSSYPIVGIEAAILIEAGFTEDVDQVVLVYAPQEIRLRRAVSRDACAAEQIQQRMRNQMPDEDKMAFAHHIIYNDDKQALIPQLGALIKTLA
ncbi:Dephospho-CoA kinase [bioreactor metagenome]|jgi:dephospho-CoA kinase|uniref:Dephospho-CoA kinase n=3 Tax=root TaxID=1 RepID=A0A069D158_9BACE|nr:dephospho-CoA kinase [Bacteroides graminisolvens]MBP6980948.1 dephospho-CoA kinase [Bacteroides sp.]MBP9720480.1 dephospho-CoA kinase [Bacteroides sp.]MCD8573173.1 dephospho-CoA kinase [Bacteroides graminisolvens]MEA4887136.1 dephospho-CoA kinase [Bacteroides graminisolvens]GAK36628.1 dephospho-CoA kinase [Bacteroides graminisolvens DSM 19988 = JCM 15093]